MTNKSTHESIEAKLAAHDKGHGKGKKEDAPAADAALETPRLDQAAYEELMKQLSEAEQKSAQNWDRILRMQAEMENASRRTERDVANAHKYALEKFVNELLPVIDNLERTIAAAQESKVDAKAILEGVDLTLKMLHSVMEKVGVKQVNPLNETFNPLFHEAVSIQESGSKPGQVLAVLQKGYLLNDRLVRPAMVVVSK
jgi:molecular chaperone GrpE